ncbi:MAG: Fic family protein [Bacteroidota bacterium]
MRYIHQNTTWPNFTWSQEELQFLLGTVRNLQGKLMGKMESIGFNLKSEALLQTLSLDVIKSSEIEGEILNAEQVRSSIARKLRMDISGLVPSDRHTDGMVDMMLDATQNFSETLTKKRLFAWHAALFPLGKSSMYEITVAKWRNDSTGPMQVVSGAMGKERVHFEAPDSALLEKEMSRFITWFNKEKKLDPVIKAAVAHLWFITIHPFDDGNGRVARALTHMLLARSDNSSQRFYSMSAQIRIERKMYYDILEKTQKGNLDITNWLQWFLKCMLNALNNTDSAFNKIILKAKFWKKYETTNFNDRQKLLINKLLDGFDGKLSSSKWAKIAKCSADTALRDIQDLINKGVLKKDGAGGRSTNYELNADNFTD